MEPIFWLIAFGFAVFGFVLGWVLHALMVPSDDWCDAHPATCEPLRRPDPAPAPAPPPAPVAAPRQVKPTVCVRLMDANERRVIRTYTIDAAARRPTLTFPEGKYICARQNARGEWIYREVRH